MISWKGIWERSTLVNGWTVFTSGSPTIRKEKWFVEKKGSWALYFHPPCNNLGSLHIKSHPSWWFPPKRRWFLQRHFHWSAARTCPSVFSSAGTSLWICPQNPWCGCRPGIKTRGEMKQETSNHFKSMIWKSWAALNTPIPPQVFKVCFHHHEDAVKPHPESVRRIFLQQNRWRMSLSQSISIMKSCVSVSMRL